MHPLPALTQQLRKPILNVTVIIPCFNCAQFLPRALYSVFNQSHEVKEIILVNNNSTDNTQIILEQWKLKYPDKIILLNEEMKGASQARNKGLRQAKSEWIQFLDADDELHIDKIKVQIESFNTSNKNADLIIGGCILISKSHKYERPLEKNDLWKGLIFSQLGITSANLYKKEKLIEIGGWNSETSSSQEYELTFRLLKNNAIGVICQQPLTYIHVQDNSIHKSKNEERFIEIMENNINLRLKIRDYFIQQNVFAEKIKLHVSKYIFTYLMNTTGKFPAFKHNSKIGKYVNKKVNAINLTLPFSFLMNTYLIFLRKKIKNRLFKHSIK